MTFINDPGHPATLFLFPYGGGSAASYRAYVARFPAEVATVVPLEIPGRGSRSGEGFARSIGECAERSLDRIDTAGGAYILHGHCMGALLAFEAIKRIEAAGAPPPLFLVASGRNAPGHVNDWLRRADGVDDHALFAELQALGGIPRGLSFAMAQPFLAVIRADQAMFRDYDPGPTRIGVPVLALAGRDDRMTDAAGLADWAKRTSAFAAVEWFDGGHYFLLDDPEGVARRIAAFAAAEQAVAAQ